MLRKLDNYLLDKLDAGVAILQRRGVRLTIVHVVASAATLFFSLSAGLLPEPDPVGLGISVTVWGSWLFAYVKWAEANKDYPWSVRVMEQLNARAISYREGEIFIRCAWALVFLAAVTATLGYGVTPSRTVNTLGSLSGALMWYLNGCMFLGPGNFASKRNRQPAQGVVSHET